VGADNVSIGPSAISVAGTGSVCLGPGTNAGANNSVSIGNGSGLAGIGNLNSISIGSGAGTALAGDNAICIGTLTTTSGASSVAMGNVIAANGDSIVAIGTTNSVLSSNCVAIGDNITVFGTSATSVAIGSVNSLAAGSSLCTVLGNNNSLGTTTTESIVIGSGNTVPANADHSIILGVGLTGSVGRTLIGGIATSPATVGDTVLVTAGNVLGIATSSIRYKENVQDIDLDLEKICNLRPVQFNYKTDETKAKIYGLIAEETLQVAPSIVNYKDGEPNSVRYIEVIALLLQAVKELKNQVYALKSRLGDAGL
jgi:hypothetical protein